MTRMVAATARRMILVLAVCAAAGGVAADPQRPSYSRSFAGDTMRVDFLHTGGPGGEQLSLDQVVHEGPWPGSHTRLIDDTNLGEFFFDVSDRASGSLLYSR